MSMGRLAASKRDMSGGSLARKILGSPLFTKDD
jgi:hypothetical protein